jgi:hypothetical protein
MRAYGFEFSSTKGIGEKLLSKRSRMLYVRHGLARLANADFPFVIASQGEMADAMGFPVE